MNPVVRFASALSLNFCLLAQQLAADLQKVTFDSAEWVPMQSISQTPGWLLVSGNASVSTDGEGVGGGKALKIPAGSADETRVHRQISWTAGDDQVAFMDFSIRPAAEDDAAAPSMVHANGCHIEFVKNSDGRTGTVWVYSGNDHAPDPGAEAEGLKATAAVFDLDATGARAASYLRVTIRQDLMRNVWDLFVDGKMVAANLDTEGRTGVLQGIDFFNGVNGEVLIDDLQATPDNKLFADSDKDGLPDSWEEANGSDKHAYDRDQSPGGNGSSFLDSYLASLWPLAASPRINNATVPAASGTIPALTLPAHSPVGSLKGSFSVGADGGASYTLPIDVPKGIAGMEPRISLDYSSTSGNGIAGLGWSIGGLQTITRGPATVAKDGEYDPVDFNGKDRFLLNGQRLVCVDGVYGAPGSEYRTEIDSHARVTALGAGPDSWKVETKSGLTMYFGTDGGSRITEPRGTLSWGLSKVEDSCGNYYTISYTSGSHSGYGHVDHRVSEIRYTGHAGTAGKCRIEFEYEDRPDKRRLYAGGLSSRSSKRLSKILVRTQDYVNHSYRLAYVESHQTGRSLLKSITKHMEDRGQAAWTVPPTTFQYDGHNDSASTIWEDPAWTPLSEYGTNLDGNGALNSMVCAGEDSREIQLTGDASRAYKLPSDFRLHSDTWVKFEFKSYKLSNGAIFGVDSNRQYDNGNGCALFRIKEPSTTSNVNMGGSNFSGPTKEYNLGEGWRKYNTSIGHLATGPMSHLVLMLPDNNQNDGQDSAYFRNITFYRKDNSSATPVEINFNFDTEVPSYTDGTGKDLGITWMDLDSDGLPDIADWRVISYNTGAGSPPELLANTIGHAYRNTGDGFIIDGGIRPPGSLPLGCRAADTVAADYVSKHQLLAQPVDIDSDGRIDLMAAENVRSSSGHIRNHHSFYLRSGGIWGKKSAWDLPFRSENIPSSLDRGGHRRHEHLTFADLDNDGYQDLLVHTSRSGKLVDPSDGSQIIGPEKSIAYRNKGKNMGWAVNWPRKLPVPLMEEGLDVGRRLIDIDGNGRLDIVEASDLGNGVRKWFRLEDSTNEDNSMWRVQVAKDGFTPRYSLPLPLVDANSVPLGVSLVDLNGDGLPDILKRLLGENSKVWINEAEGGDTAWKWEAPTSDGTAREDSYSIPFPLHFHHDGVKKPYGFELADINGDGLVDILYSETSDPNRPGPANVCLLNTGDGWRQRGLWGLPDGLRFFASAADRNAGKRSCTLQDINGDGFPDLVAGLLDGTSQVWYNRCRPEVMTSATDGFGADIQIGYRRLNDPTPVKHGSVEIFGRAYTKGPDAPAGQAAVIDSRLVVTSYSETDGNGGKRVRYQRYGDLRQDTDNQTSLGFGWIEVMDQLTGQLTRTDTRRDFPFAGSPDVIQSWVEVKSGDLDPALTGVTVGRKRLTWEKADYSIQTSVAGQGGTVLGIVQTHSEKKNWDLTGGLVSHRQTNQLFDEHGFATSVLVTSLLDNAITVTVNTYDHVTTNSRWHLGRLSRSSVTKSGAGKPMLSRTSAFTYDPGTGLLESETIEPDNPSYRSTKTYRRDAYGNIDRTTLTAAAIERVSTSFYGDGGRFLASETNALGHTIRYDYDDSRALLASVTDANGRISRYEYDNFGTLVLTENPDGTRTGEHTGFCSNLELPVAVRSLLTGTIRHFRAGQASGTPVATVYLDALGRELATETTVLRDARATGAARYSKVYTVSRYDSLGRRTHVYEPFFTTDGSVNVSRITYDLLGRPLVTTHPDDSTDVLKATSLVTLDGRPHTWSRTVSRGGMTLERWEDQHGRLIQSKDSSGLVTTFAYDHDGRLTTATVGGVKLLENTYDILGNKTAVWEANSGTSSSAFNAIGEVTSTTNARGATTFHTYDALGRPETSSLPEGVVYTKEYDPAGNKGLPSAVTGTDGSSESTAYDYYGRVVSTTVTRATSAAPTGETFTTRATYDALGRVHTATDAGDLMVVHEYDPLYSFPVRQSVGPGSHGAGTVLWAAGWYDSKGRSREETLGLGVTRTAEYAPLTGLVTSLGATRSGAQLQASTMGWDSRGNLTNRSNLLAGRHEVFTYDAINRLTNVKVTAASGAASQTIPADAVHTYDINGNLRGKPRSQLDYGGVRPHAVSAATIKGVAHTYTYDAAGYMTGDLVGSELRREFGWTSFGQLRSLDYRSAPELRTLSGGLVHAAGRVQTDFFFGAGGGRTRQLKQRIHADDSRDIEETLYLGGYERENHSSIEAGTGYAVLRKTVHRHSIGGSAVYTRTEDGNGPVVRLSTVLKEHLGSTECIVTGTWDGTSFANVTTERQSFDAWGERRDPATLVNFRSADADPFRTSAADHDRGFTGHEQLDDSGLIHMNGRIYDPELGRMLSPDPFVQVPEYSQNFNRYSYVLNNPLNKTDPTGYSWLSNAFDKVGDWLSENWRTVVAIVVAVVITVVSYGTLSGWGAGAYASIAGTTASSAAATTAGAAYAGAVIGATTGAFNAAIHGGAWGDIGRGALVGGIQGGITGGLLHGWEPSAAGWNFETGRHIVGHGVVGGAANEAMGGKFQDGFLSAAASAAAADFGMLGDPNAKGAGAVASRTIRAGIVGGTASAIGGGKFANGAYTAAFQHLLNQELPAAVKSRIQTPEEGKGIILRRSYTLDFEGSKLSAEEIMQAFIDDPNQFTKSMNPALKTEFTASLKTGAFVRINGPAGVSPSVYVQFASAESGVTLLTVKGHPEAGAINFTSFKTGKTTAFTITSLASASTHGNRLAYFHGGHHLQTNIWHNVLKNVYIHAGGTNGVIDGSSIKVGISN